MWEGAVMKRMLLALSLSLLLGMAITLSLAFWLVVPRGKPWLRRPAINIIGPQAAALPLPARTPHTTPWPPAHQWSETASFGRRRFTTWHINGANQTTHQIDAAFYGWPLPALRHIQFWWPWNDAAWATPEPGDHGLRPCWPGMLLNPLAFSLVLWPLLTCPWWVRAMVRFRRLRRGLCPACAYDLAGNTSGVCPECGITSTAPNAAPLIPVP
jgi:hypothetical protein